MSKPQAASDLRAKAEACRSAAQLAPDPILRMHWLDLASQWLTLSKSVERLTMNRAEPQDGEGRRNGERRGHLSAKATRNHLG